MQLGDALPSCRDCGAVARGVVQLPLHEVGERGRRQRRVRRDGQGRGVQAAVVVRPALHLQLPQRNVDEHRVGAKDVLRLARGAVQPRQLLLQVVHVEGQHHVGLGQQLFLGLGRVERVVRGEVEEVAAVDHRQREALRQSHQPLHGLVGATEEVCEHDGVLGRHERARHPLQRRGVGLHSRGRGVARHVRHLERLRELLLLDVGVEANVDGALGLGDDQVVGADERLDGGLDAGGLVVPLHEVADRFALHVGGVNPVDPRTAVVGVERARRAEHQHAGAPHPRVEHRHRRVQQPDDVVHKGGHGLARRTPVPLRDGDRDLLVVAEDELRPRVAHVVDHGVMDASEGGAGVHGNVLDAKGANRVHDDVGAVLGGRKAVLARFCRHGGLLSC